MSDFVIVFGLTLLPARGNFGLLAEYLPTSKRSRALDAASGNFIAIVAVELIPARFRRRPVGSLPWRSASAALPMSASRRSLSDCNKRSDGDDRTSRWMIYVAVAVDLFSDGLMIGAGSAVATSLALVQVLADVPEGFATIAKFKTRTSRAGGG